MVTRSNNYWRDGVRPIDELTYKAIVQSASPGAIRTDFGKDGQNNDGFSLYESGEEGIPKLVYTTIYERDRKLRNQAILIHGTICKACNFDFFQAYGEAGSGYIHIDHRVAIATAGGSVKVNPETDLVPVCANCHSIIHRRRNGTLSVEPLQEIVRDARSMSAR
jgi:putative restriction endonuclease